MPGPSLCRPFAAGRLLASSVGALTSSLCFRYGSYMIWKELGGFSEEAVVPLGLYAGQLALNWAWPPLFFGARQMGWVSVALPYLPGPWRWPLPWGHGASQPRQGQVEAGWGRRLGLRDPPIHLVLCTPAHGVSDRVILPILQTRKLRQRRERGLARPLRVGCSVPSGPVAVGPVGTQSLRPPCPPSPVSPQALVDLVLTGGVAAATAVAWYQVSPLAARLLYPYLAWLAFAATLNYCVWRDNQGRRGGRRPSE